MDTKRGLLKACTDVAKRTLKDLGFNVYDFFKISFKKLALRLVDFLKILRRLLKGHKTYFFFFLILGGLNIDIKSGFSKQL